MKNFIAVFSVFVVSVFSIQEISAQDYIIHSMNKRDVFDINKDDYKLNQLYMTRGIEFYGQQFQEDSESTERELNKILAFAQRNPNTLLEIGVHSQYLPKDPYGFRVDTDQKRALLIINWLIEKGVPTKQIVGAGYGSSNLVALCIEEDNPDCQKMDKYYNIRVEVKIINQASMDKARNNLPQRRR